MKPKAVLQNLLKIGALSAAVSLAIPAFAMDEADVEPYLKKQGCFKCHALDKTKKGPSYKKIADKYKGKPDGEAKIVKHITSSPKVKLEDGTEEEHKVIETKDAAEQKAIAKWILSR